MELTPELLVGYTNGQVLMLNLGMRWAYQGQAESIYIQGGLLKIKFTWLARRESVPYRFNGYHNANLEDGDLDYEIELSLCQIKDIGAGYIHLDAPSTGELITLLPPGAKDWLSPATVQDLPEPPGGWSQAATS